MVALDAQQHVKGSTTRGRDLHSVEPSISPTAGRAPLMKSRADIRRFPSGCSSATRRAERSPQQTTNSSPDAAPIDPGGISLPPVTETSQNVSLCPLLS